MNTRIIYLFTLCILLSNHILFGQCMPIWHGYSSHSVTDSTITLDWYFDPDNGATEKFNISYRTNDFVLGVGDWQDASPTNFSKPPFTIKKLLPNTTYDVEIIKYCYDGSVETDAPLSPITTAVGATFTNKGPVIVGFYNIGNNEASVDFAYYILGSGNATLGFDAYYRVKNAADPAWNVGYITGWPEPGEDFATDAIFQNLTPGTTYEVQIVEHCQMNPGTSARTDYDLYSSISTFKTTGYGPNNPPPPTAIASMTTQYIPFGTCSTTLYGNTSKSPYATITSYFWRQLPTKITYNPVVTTHTPSFAWPMQNTSANTTVVDLVSGYYVYELAVTNSNKITKTDTISFAVLGPCGAMPGNFTVKRHGQVAQNFYSGTISDYVPALLTTQTHTMKASAVMLLPGFVTNVSGTGAFVAQSYNPLSCPGIPCPTPAAAPTGTLATIPDANIKVTGLLKVFPNPTSGWLNLELSRGEEQINKISLSDISGRVLYTNVSGDTEIDLSHLSPGMYIYRVETNTQTYLGKLSKQ